MPFRVYINGRLGRFKKSCKKEKALIFAFILVIILFSITLFFSKEIIHAVRPLIKNEISKAEEVLNEELAYVSKQTRDITVSGVLNNYIKKGDILNLISLLNDEKDKRNLEIALVTDGDGTALTRTEVIGVRGDNIFQTTTWGRALSQGEEVVSIERGKPLPLVLIAGYPIKENGEIIGSLFAGYSIDDNYAVRFKEKYSLGRTQLAFYTTEEGIIGTTFQSSETTNILNTYFGIGSDLVMKGLPSLAKEVQIEGQYYFVKNITFPGIEKSPGGVFILTRSPHLLQALAFGVIIALFFLLLESIIHFTFFNRSLSRRKHTIILIIASFVLFLITIYVALYKLDKDAIELKKPPYLIYNAVLKFEPEADVIDRLFEKQVVIKLFTGGEAINAVGVEINYDPRAAEVLDIITTKSFCYQDLFIQKNIDNENGKVEIACGLPSPGFQERSGIVAELLVQPLKSGELALKFGEGTQVLADDGLGTNVLRLAIDGSYQVRSYAPEEEATGPIPVFSYTHPNSERWYQRKEISFSWPHLEGTTGYRYTFNQIPDFIPGKENITQDNFLQLSVEQDGIYYFHLMPEKENAAETISHLKVMIDSTPPLSPEIQVSDKEINKGEVVRFDFTAEDELSGLQAGFYVKVIEGIFLPVKAPLYMPFLERGEYSVTIRAFDKAGNFNDSEVKIKVGMK